MQSQTGGNPYGGSDRTPSLIGPHGGYRQLKSYQGAAIIYDATIRFCERFIDRRSRTTDQMIQAARSGKQNIAEGSMASATSKKTQLKLIGVARASLEGLLLDYEDFLRQNRLPMWGKGDIQSEQVRKLVYRSDRSYETYKTYIEKASADVAANTLICLIHQTNYLLDQQLRRLERDFLDEGGFTEKLYRLQRERRRSS
jgi:four helix bundle suffix protein